MEEFEQYKMLCYLNNALQNRAFFKEHLGDVHDWHEDQGKNIVDYVWVQKREERRFEYFKNIINDNKEKAYKRGEEFILVINKKIKSLKKCNLSIIEKRIRLVSVYLHHKFDG